MKIRHSTCDNASREINRTFESIAGIDIDGDVVTVNCLDDAGLMYPLHFRSGGKLRLYHNGSFLGDFYTEAGADVAWQDAVDRSHDVNGHFHLSHPISGMFKTYPTKREVRLVNCGAGEHLI